MIIAGPCLIENDPNEFANAFKTADGLAAIDKDINFRAKIWGGGLTPDIYFPGVGPKEGLEILGEIGVYTGLNVGTEIQSSERLPIVAGNVDFIWVAARCMQSYGLLAEVGIHREAFKHITIKRHYGSPAAEAIGIHDICVHRHGFKPFLCERGVNSFEEPGQCRWIPDFRFMANVLRERPDIDLMFDPCHSSFNRENVFAFTKAARAIGVKHFMFEVYADPKQTQVDKQHALSIDDMKRLRDIIGEV